jgi:uncharacterized Zn finger protein (UPF0148 family)
MAISGPRQTAMNAYRHLVGRATARSIRGFIVPGNEVARAAGIEFRVAGIDVVPTPRHANLLVLVGPISADLGRASVVIYAQMPRPRAILALGVVAVDGLPVPDVSVARSQAALQSGVDQIRRAFADGAFAAGAAGFAVDLGRTTTTYVCPMHANIVRDEPGVCPICGMALVPRAVPDKRDQMPSQSKHHQESSHATETPVKDESDSDDEYTCPMHPDVVQSTPGSCPICGMNLTPKSAEHDASHQHHTQDGSHQGSRDTSHETTANGQQEQQEKAADEDHEASPGARADGSTPGDARLEHGGDHNGGEGADEHQGHEGHGGDSGGFMSMVAMTKELPRSRDGLPMEHLDVLFGPLFPGLPGGLHLMLTLDGDTVAKASVTPGTVVHMDALAGNDHPWDDLPRSMSDLDRLAPGVYAVLARKALGSLDGAEYVRQLERFRAISHLGWIAGLGELLGDDWLRNTAGQLQSAMLQSDDGPLDTTIHTRVTAFVARVHHAPLLRRRLTGIGWFDPVSNDQLLGPVARAAGQAVDERLNDPVYQRLHFQPVTRDGNDAHARLGVRLAEVLQSFDLIQRAGDAGMTDADRRPDAMVSIEAPRGRASIHLNRHGEHIAAVHLRTPSAQHLDLISLVTHGAEVADALISIASLDLSPWEIDQ